MAIPTVNFNLEPVRGRDYSVQVPIVDVDGDAADLTGLTFISTLRAAQVLDVTSPPTSLGTLTVAESEDSGTLDVTVLLATLETLITGIIYFFDVIGYTDDRVELLVQGTLLVSGTTTLVPAVIPP